MKKNRKDEKIEEIVNSFGNTMKKGYTNGLILLVLESEPCHGYGIKNKIYERTLGVWKPESSTIYPILESLNDRGLIKCIEVDESKRHKKVYAITPKGEETLQMLLQKLHMMSESMKSIVLSTVGIADAPIEEYSENLEKLMSFHYFGIVSEENMESKLELLKYSREMTKQRINIMKHNLTMIDKMISKLDKEINHKNDNEIHNNSNEIASH